MKVKLLKKIRKYYLVKYNVVTARYTSSKEYSVKEHVILNIVTKEVVDKCYSLEGVIERILINISDSLYYKFKEKKEKLRERKKFNKYLNMDIPQKF